MQVLLLLLHNHLILTGKKIFDGADWFHFTGITPALNDEVADICIDACKAAKEAGLAISCDLNYRNKLWSKEKAGKIMGKNL